MTIRFESIPTLQREDLFGLARQPCPSESIARNIQCNSEERRHPTLFRFFARQLALNPDFIWELFWTYHNNRESMAILKEVMFDRGPSGRTFLEEALHQQSEVVVSSEEALLLISNLELLIVPLKGEKSIRREFPPAQSSEEQFSETLKRLRNVALFVLCARKLVANPVGWLEEEVKTTSFTHHNMANAMRLQLAFDTSKRSHPYFGESRVFQLMERGLEELLELVKSGDPDELLETRVESLKKLLSSAMLSYLQGVRIQDLEFQIEMLQVEHGRSIAYMSSELAQVRRYIDKLPPIRNRSLRIPNQEITDSLRHLFRIEPLKFFRSWTAKVNLRVPKMARRFNRTAKVS